jgi:hypothetical protein
MGYRSATPGLAGSHPHGLRGARRGAQRQPGMHGDRHLWRCSGLRSPERDERLRRRSFPWTVSSRSIGSYSGARRGHGAPPVTAEQSIAWFGPKNAKSPRNRRSRGLSLSHLLLDLPSQRQSNKSPLSCYPAGKPFVEVVVGVKPGRHPPAVAPFRTAK